jgi:hypothetical protein
MIKINIYKAKIHLSRYLAMLSKKDKRPVLAKGTFKVPRKFFEPLPDEMLKKFTGELP